MNETKYNHGEAFCLMSYACQECGHHIRIWNSRDGVTPFVVGCVQPNCEGDMHHINWHNDERFEFFVPPVGSYYFKDFSDIVKAEQVARKRVESNEELFEKQFPGKDKEEFIKELAEDILGDGHGPTMEKVTYPVHTKFKARAQEAAKNSDL